MKIHVNDETRESADGQSVEALVAELGLAGQRGVALAINDEVVPRASWGARLLAEGDAVLVIRASQGG